MQSLRLVLLLCALLVLAPALPAAAQTGAVSPRALSPDAGLPLEGTPWRLRSYARGDTVRQAGPEVAAWMQLRGGRLQGSGGCNALRGSYAAMGGALKVNLGKTRTPTCAEQTTIVQLAMVDGLAAAASYELMTGDTAHGTTLLIRDGDDAEVLRFGIDDLADLEANEWQLEAYVVAGGRTTADELQPAVLSFEPRKQANARRRSAGGVVGSTGCNGVVADYFRHADALSFGRLDRTDAPCDGSAGAQEDAIVAVLDASSITIDLLPDRLLLTADDSGDQLDLRSSTPLEGTTWLLAELGKDDASAATVTMWLRDGQVSGEGPCGSYAGDYVTDGLFITISSLERGANADCPGRALQRKLLAALARGVRVDRADGDLTIQDAAGKELVAFSAPGSP